LGFKRIGSRLTFQGHDGPFNSPLSYWWSFGNNRLSLTVSEIFNGECDAMVLHMTVNYLLITTSYRLSILL